MLNRKPMQRETNPWTNKALKEDYIRTFIRIESTSLYSQGWTMVQLNKLTFEELKQEFEKLMRSIKRIVPMRSEERIKRPGIELEQEPSKKQKTVGSEEVPVIQENVEEPVIVKEEEIAKPVKKTGKRRKTVARKRRFSQATAKGDDEDSEYEKEKEQLSLYLTIASDEDKEVDYEILDQKSLIIEWKSEYYGLKPMLDEVEVLEEINVMKTPRRKGSKRQINQDVDPQVFDRILWGDLTTMFHLIELDKVCKSQQNWNIVSRKLHNSSGVHTLQTDTDMIIYMLVEKKYPLMKKILLQMQNGRFDVFFRNQLLVFEQHQDKSLYDSWTRFKDIIRKVPNHGLSIWTLIEIFLKHLDSLSQHIINLTAERDLRKFSDIGAWDDMVRVQVPRCMAWLDYDEHVDSLCMMDNKVRVTSPESTTQTLPLFEEYTLPVTYSEEVEKTLGTPIEVEPLNETKLEEVGLNCNHNTPLSSREVPSFDGPEPQPLLNSPSLYVSLGDVIGPEPPIKPHSPDSSRMKLVDY
ncbi:hypothetical protein Tco_1237943 [Tanacetum coccineum]